MLNAIENEKFLAAQEAVKLIKDNQVVGLGTGSTAYYAIVAVGELVKKGLNVKAVPTSNRTKELAEELGIPVIDINDVETIDITIDGADEFTSDMLLIKGGGGALLREKIVASMSTQEIIIADSLKKVDQLGKFPLPVEVTPFAANYVKRKLTEVEGSGKIRMKDGQPYLTDQGNYIIDVHFGIIKDPVFLSDYLNNLEGTVGHGLFINLATKVIMGVSATNDTVVFG